MIFKRKDPDSLWDKKLYRKSRNRTKTMEGYQMFSWLDMAGTEMARLLNQYRRTNDPADLGELKYSITTFAAMINELESRRGY